MARTIEIEDRIAIGTLAEKLELPASRLIGELMKNGIMATVNEQIDFDTAEIIVNELGLDDVSLVKKQQEQEKPRQSKRSSSSDAPQRPPIVAVMGHVDHGKTTLMDKIRGASVAQGEAGGITQHISAYQIEHGDRMITLLDTPGHEAFAALRQHGAHLTDIAIIVVAADDGVKPQTLEAIRFARNSGAKIVVAINKVDKEGIDVNRIKQQLSEQKLLVEEWGGDTITVEVSAKTGQGVDKLLDMVLLVADLEDLRADVVDKPSGLIIEARQQKGLGAVAHALVESGTLRLGDFIVAGKTYAKIRSLESTGGEKLTRATPSTPVVISGFKDVPSFGDEFHWAEDEREARRQVAKAADSSQDRGRGNVTGSDLIRMINRKNKMQELNIIIRADVQGSLTSAIDSLRTIETDEVSANIVSSGVGPISENDLQLASSSGAIIYGFSVGMSANIKRMAAKDGVEIRIYDVIYEMLDDIRQRLSDLLLPEVVETDTGRLVVRGVFKTAKSEGICGGEVTKGKLTTPSFARVMRGNEQVAEISITNLRQGPQDAKEVLEGQMCGVSYNSSSRVDLQEGDRLEFFTRASKTRTL